jgi:hypothetical protein
MNDQANFGEKLINLRKTSSYQSSILFLDRHEGCFFEIFVM